MATHTPLNTPHKGTDTSSLDSHLRSSIYDAERVVANEMDGHAYGNTEGLIDTFLGDSAPLINKITDRIYRVLVKSKAYDPNKQIWKHLPTSPRNETVLYSPLTKLLNQILELCKEALYEVHWRDEHASPPKSDFQDQSRPDLISTTIAALLWWRAIHSLIEVKKDVDDSAALQLLRYIRSTLREQPDRRFMYGLVFARRALTLWQVDRSGSLAAPPFDIHKVGFILVFFHVAVHMSVYELLVYRMRNSSSASLSACS